MPSVHERLPSLQGFHARSPSPALAAYVQRFWWLDGDAAVMQNEQMLHPDGASGVIFNFADPMAFDGCLYRPGTLVAGPQLTSARLQLAGRVNLMGVRFRAGMGAPFLGVGLDELAGFHDADGPRPALAGLVEHRVADAGILDEHQIEERRDLDAPFFGNPVDEQHPPLVRLVDDEHRARDLERESGVWSPEPARETAPSGATVFCGAHADTMASRSRTAAASRAERSG